MYIINCFIIIIVILGSCKNAPLTKREIAKQVQKRIKKEIAKLQSDIADKEGNKEQINANLEVSKDKMQQLLEDLDKFEKELKGKLQADVVKLKPSLKDTIAGQKQDESFIKKMYDKFKSKIEDIGMSKVQRDTIVQMGKYVNEKQEEFAKLASDIYKERLINILLKDNEYYDNFIAELESLDKSAVVEKLTAIFTGDENSLDKLAGQVTGTMGKFMAANINKIKSLYKNDASKPANLILKYLFCEEEISAAFKRVIISLDRGGITEKKIAQYLKIVKIICRILESSEDTVLLEKMDYDVRRIELLREKFREYIFLICSKIIMDRAYIQRLLETIKENKLYEVTPDLGVCMAICMYLSESQYKIVMDTFYNSKNAYPKWDLMWYIFTQKPQAANDLIDAAPLDYVLDLQIQRARFYIYQYGLKNADVIEYVKNLKKTLNDLKNAQKNEIPKGDINGLEIALLLNDRESAIYFCNKLCNKDSGIIAKGNFSHMLVKIKETEVELIDRFQENAYVFSPNIFK